MCKYRISELEVNGAARDAERVYQQTVSRLVDERYAITNRLNDMTFRRDMWRLAALGFVVVWLITLMSPLLGK